MTQLFKTKIPTEILIDLFLRTSIKQDECFVFNLNSYKKGIFTGDILIFIDLIKPYYYQSKQKYVERKITYNTCTTIIRQICNYNNITYKSEIKYDKSTYNITYYIYVEPPILNDTLIPN